MNQHGLCYFDNNATTPVAPEVVEAMLPFLREFWGNPSSAYYFGHQVLRHLDNARERIAALINADARDLVFTSCGTESSNTAIHSALVTQPGKRHIVTTQVEHSATLKYCRFLEKQGYEVTFLPVTTDGALNLGELGQSIRSDTAIVSIMWANNETGVLFPVREIANICSRKGVLFYTDAVQVAGKLPVDVKVAGMDFLSLSAHKLHAPKGIGALYVKRGTKFQPYLIGGNQERGRRGGTENVPSMVAFGRAAEMAMSRLDELNGRVRVLRDQLESGVLRRIAGTSLNGEREPRLPNTANISFHGIEAEGILMLLDRAGICASSGSACTSGSLDPSHVLTAMGFGPARARGSVRFSLSAYNTEAEVEYVLGQLPGIVDKLRANTPFTADLSDTPVASTV